MAADASCPPPEIPTTIPAPVDTDAVLKSLGEIKTLEGLPAFTIDAPLQEAIRHTFSVGEVKTKMEQFYATLFLIQNYSTLKPGVVHTVEGKELADVLMLSGVFPDKTLPEQIDKMSFRRSSLTPMYEVTFKQPSVELPLNRGKGFSTMQHGKCQHARALLFHSPFRFYMQRLENGNLKIHKFQNVDIVGEFGTRGLLDIDLNYVSLVSVEFIRKTSLGYVQARVAEKEFQVNDHGWFLKMITSFFSDTTKQAIDW